MKLLSTLVFALSAFCIASVQAAPKKAQKPENIDPAAEGIGAPHQQEIWKYTYSPDVIYRIYTTTKRHVRVELGEDEGLTEEPRVGDSIQWRVSGGPRNIYIKPVRDNIETTLTIVTNKRSYEFQLISSSAETAKHIFQKISFDYPDHEAQFKMLEEKRVATVKAEADRLNSQIISKGINPADLNFAYKITGDASFKPTSAYSDDKFTYLVMPPKLQDMPGIFLVQDDGSLSIVSFKPKDPSTGIVVVERVAKKLMLKIGDAEVLVDQKGR